MPNRLAREKSPYLLQHSQNPVEWFPWGEEAFSAARTQNKPIFLSIGYSTCHWCHVMEHESFESPELAAVLNEHFISIKVDREERPDVDHVYMTFVQATTGHGGWPMSVWLTPDRKPFYGGTYFPPTDRYGRAGFRSILERIHLAWTQDRAKIEQQAGSLTQALRDAEVTVESGTGSLGDILPILQRGLNQYARMFDSEHGGFGPAPKFPRPVNLEFLLHLATHAKLNPKDRDLARTLALVTLRKMALGGMYDHLGGGFHRYSVDARWHVPHFEKMLYDQAQLVPVYLAAAQLEPDAHFQQTALDTLHYVRHDLTAPDGGFFSAEDADSLPTADVKQKTEGAFYVWQLPELIETLDDTRATEFAAVFGVTPKGNVAHESDPHGELTGQNVLFQQLSVEEAAAQFSYQPETFAHRLRDDRAALLSRRGLRPRPHLDDKILTAWNGLMLGAVARGARLLDDPALLPSAQKAATFLKKNLYQPESGELIRSFREGPAAIPGFAADYAFLIHGLLELYAADFDLAWLQWALDLQKTLDRLFWDEAHGGYFSTTDRDPTILLRMKEDYDGAEPTPSSVAALNLWRLGHLLQDDALLDRARRTVTAFRQRLAEQPFGMPLLLVAASLLENPPVHLILHSPSREHPGLAPLLRVMEQNARPHHLTLLIANPETRAFFAPRHPMIAALPENPAQPTAYVCESMACRLPVTTPEALRESLRSLTS